MMLIPKVAGQGEVWGGDLHLNFLTHAVLRSFCHADFDSDSARSAQVLCLASFDAM